MVFTSIKYFLLIVLAVLASVYSGSLLIAICSVVEIVLLLYITNLICRKHKRVGYTINCIFSFIFLFQQAVLFFSGEYMSLMMIENVEMTGNLGEMKYLSLVALIVIVFISFIPIKYIQGISLNKKTIFSIMFFYLGISLWGFSVHHEFYSPYLMFFKSTADVVKYKLHRYMYTLSDEDKELLLQEFYKDSIEFSNVAEYKQLPEKQNVILIFTEGLSMEVLDVANNQGLNLTPCLDSLYKNSISFTNYYNHTAATFRALRGQLFSGFQYLGGPEKDGDAEASADIGVVEERTKTKLISLVDILKENGYNTSFINADPGDQAATAYFRSFHFDKYIPDGVNNNKSFTDKEVFEIAKSTVLRAKAPFFITLYNLGTHFGFDSPDIKYGDGTNSILNKFHNYDAQFGVFFDSLKKNNILDNTILILTTDHATYHSPDFKKMFNNTSGYFIDRIPLMIYWNGVDPEEVNVDGRNSLDLSPTILDLLRINHENYFLGESLFLNKRNVYNTTSAIGNCIYYIEDNKIRAVYDDNDKILQEIRKYYMISLN